MIVFFGDVDRSGRKSNCSLETDRRNDYFNNLKSIQFGHSSPCTNTAQA